MKKQIRVNEETLIDATKTYKSVKGFRSDVNHNTATEEILLQYIEDNKDV